jgi:hypothetical protein
VKLGVLTNSSRLNGLTGDKGEKHCLFMGSSNSPAGDRWIWFFTEAEAEKWAMENSILITHTCSEGR